MGSIEAPSPIRSPSLQAKTKKLSESVYQKYIQLLQDPTARILIAIGGIPGSGKRTLAAMVANHLNKQHAQETGKLNWSFAVALPVDNLEADCYHSFVTALRDPVTSETPTVFGASFERTTKDNGKYPVENYIEVGPRSRILIFEGIYCAMDRPPWRDAAMLMDELWFVDVDRHVARERLVKRHIGNKICQDEEQARYRVEHKDDLNAHDVLNNLLDVSLVVQAF